MSLFSFRVPREHFNVTHDVMRMASIQIVVQFLFSVVNAAENPFFSVMFLQTIAFVVLGVLFYWLVVRYLVRVDIDTDIDTDTDTDKPANGSYSPATYQPHELWTNCTDGDHSLNHDHRTQEAEEPPPPQASVQPTPPGNA